MIRHLTALLTVGVVSVLGVALLAPAQAAPARPTSACGATITKSDGTPWVCSFADDFDGTRLDGAKWIAQQTYTSGYQNGGECFVDSPNNVSVANGLLTLTARRESAPFTCSYPGGSYRTSYTSGMVSTYGRFAQAYGRFEVRAKFPAAKVAGLQSALWLWPQDATKYGSWPSSGEIDIAEAYSTWPDRVIPYVHYDSAPDDTTVTNNFCMITDVSQLHTYVAEWTPTSITISYDGKTCLRHSIDAASSLSGSQPFDQPFIVSLTQALGQGANAVTSSTPLPAKTQVDYVRVWK